MPTFSVEADQIVLALVAFDLDDALAQVGLFAQELVQLVELVLGVVDAAQDLGELEGALPRLAVSEVADDVDEKTLLQVLVHDLARIARVAQMRLQRLLAPVQQLGVQLERARRAHRILARLVYLTQLLHVLHVDVVSFHVAVEVLLLTHSLNMFQSTLYDYYI